MENELTKRKRAAIYIRLSSEEQAKEGYSPSNPKGEGFRVHQKQWL
jgi:hypothetical protein